MIGIGEQVAVAAALHGSGRVLTVAHEAILDAKCRTHVPAEGITAEAVAGPDVLAGSAQLFRNALLWASRIRSVTATAPLSTDLSQRNARREIRVGVWGRSLEWLKNHLACLHLSELAHVHVVGGSAGQLDLPQCDVVIWHGADGSADLLTFHDDDNGASGAFCSTAAAQDKVILQPPSPDVITAAVHAGLGVMMGSCPWGFEQITGKTIKHHSVQNVVLRSMGMAYTCQRFPYGEHMPVQRDCALTEAQHAGAVLQRIMSGVQCIASGTGESPTRQSFLLSKSDVAVLMPLVTALSGSVHTMLFIACAFPLLLESFLCCWHHLLAWRPLLKIHYTIRINSKMSL